MNLDQILANLYGESAMEPATKVAEDAIFAAQLRDNVDDDIDHTLADLSDEELEELWQQTKVAGEDSQEEIDPELEKMAMDMLGGQIMAHAFHHELGIMKEAMKKGLCRVCKKRPVRGHSVCEMCSKKSK